MRDFTGEATEEKSHDKLSRDKLAVALQYHKAKDAAPKVTAKGKGFIAEQIIAVAQANGVEIRSDEDLARMLSAVELDMPIPLEAYVAVAEILAYVYRANHQMRNKA